MFKEFELTLKHSRGEIGSKSETQYVAFDVTADKKQIVFEMEDKILDRTVYVTLTSQQALSIAFELTDAANIINNTKNKDNSKSKRIDNDQVPYLYENRI